MTQQVCSPPCSAASGVSTTVPEVNSFMLFVTGVIIICKDEFVSCDEVTMSWMSAVIIVYENRSGPKYKLVPSKCRKIYTVN